MRANSEQLYKHNNFNKATRRTGKLSTNASKLADNIGMITNKYKLVRFGFRHVRSNKIHIECLSDHNSSAAQVDDPMFMPIS